MIGHSQGLSTWLLQRFTAIYLALFLFYVILRLLFASPASYQEWRDWIECPLINIASALFFLALTMHGWVGMRDVIMDYVKPTALRVSVLVLVAFGLLACLLWSWRVLLLAV